MRPTLEELEEALETLKKADALGGHDPGGRMTVREALAAVFRVSQKQLYEAGLFHIEPPEEEEKWNSTRSVSPSNTPDNSKTGSGGE